MSAPNFHTMENFKLYVQVFESMSLDDYKAECFPDDDDYYPDYVEAEDEDDKNRILEESYDEAMKMWNYLFYDDIAHGYDGFKDLMEEFSDNLVFHKVYMKSGYYDGIQLYVEEMDNPYELDNSDCRYYYDMCRSQAIRKYDAEIRKINRWMDNVATEYGWRELHCLGIFSNGEAVYRFAE